MPKNIMKPWDTFPPEVRSKIKMTIKSTMKEYRKKHPKKPSPSKGVKVPFWEK